MQFSSILDSKQILFINFQNCFFWGGLGWHGLERMNSSAMINAIIFHLFISWVEFIGGSHSWFCFMIQFYVGFGKNVSRNLHLMEDLAKCCRPCFCMVLFYINLFWVLDFIIYPRNQMNRFNIFFTMILIFFCICRIGIEYWAMRGLFWFSNFSIIWP